MSPETGNVNFIALLSDGRSFQTQDMYCIMGLWITRAKFGPYKIRK